MPRISKNPIIIDHLPSIEASWIVRESKKWTCFEIRWTRLDNTLASTKCKVEPSKGSLRVFFRAEGNQTQEFKITFTESNLGIGKVPFFVCPYSSNKYRKVYLINDRFQSRFSIFNSFYITQLATPKQLMVINWLKTMTED